MPGRSWRWRDAGLRFGGVDELPLSALLARALGDLTQEFNRTRADTDSLPSLPMWLGLLRALTLEGVAGWILVDSEPGLTGRHVKLSSEGHRIGEVCRPMIEAVEQRWVTRIGLASVA